mgnify:CR=1 FL=1|tara:strand:+ start:332 stop:811 length:480 start_codon:yes stop_codon:yes gene_type:complete
MMLKEATHVQDVGKIIETDPVRRHIVPALRLKNGARVFYYGTPEDLIAAVCMHTSRIIPDSEEQLLTEYHWGGGSKGGTKAIFYTVWSNRKGFGKQILNTALAQLVIENKHERYITLSPKTEMAKQFHESNGAKLIHESLWAYNFEYNIGHGHHDRQFT